MHGLNRGACTLLLSAMAIIRANGNFFFARLPNSPKVGVNFTTPDLSPRPAHSTQPLSSLHTSSVHIKGGIDRATVTMQMQMRQKAALGKRAAAPARPCRGAVKVSAFKQASAPNQQVVS